MRRLLKASVAIALPLLLCATAVLASEGGGHEAMPLDKILWEMGIKILDVAIIAFLGFKFLSKPIAQAMADRSAAVRRALDEAQAGQREAEERLQALKVKTAGLDIEIAALRSQAAADMERERAILIEEGKSAAEHVAQHTRETIRQEVAKARAELHREAAELAVRLAEEQVRSAMTAADQHRLAGDYLKEMETVR